MLHITRRMNIVNILMTDGNSIEEVKGNMMKFNEVLEDFKDLHAFYVELLDEDARKEDNENWYQPRCAQITDFLSSVTEWILAGENPCLLQLG